MKELWAKPEAEFHGTYYDFPPVRVYPKPAQKPHPPVLLGGSARNVFQRIVAWGDGCLPNRVTPEQRRESSAIGSWGGRRLSLGGDVTGTGPTDGAAAARGIGLKILVSAV